MTRKTTLIGEMKGKFDKSTSVVFVNYQGMTVETATKLRAQFRKAGVEYLVVKNTLVRHALKETEYVRAAKALGAHGAMLVVRHIVPNILPTLVVYATDGSGPVYGDRHVKTRRRDGTSSRYSPVCSISRPSALVRPIVRASALATRPAITQVDRPLCSPPAPTRPAVIGAEASRLRTQVPPSPAVGGFQGSSTTRQ